MSPVVFRDRLSATLGSMWSLLGFAVVASGGVAYSLLRMLA